MREPSFKILSSTVLRSGETLYRGVAFRVDNYRAACLWMGANMSAYDDYLDYLVEIDPECVECDHAFTLHGNDDGSCTEWDDDCGCSEMRFPLSIQSHLENYRTKESE